MIDRCRTCWKKVNIIKALRIFSEANSAVLSQIELITGVSLPYMQGFPTSICLECQLKLTEVIAFRECCIETQKNILREFSKYQHEAKEILDNQSKNTFIVVEETDPLVVDKNNVNEVFDVDLEECHDNHNKSERLYQLKIQEDDDDEDSEMQELVSEKKVKLEKNVSKSDVYVCEMCGKHFLCKRNLDLHQLRHTGIKPYECDNCSARFYTTDLLKMHSRQHTNPFKCSYCKKTFGYNSSKVRHERIHRNEKPFQCRYCEKSFRCSSGRKGHEVTHTRVRKFECKICGLWFLTNKHLNTHRRTKIHELNTVKLSNNMTLM